MQQINFGRFRVEANPMAGVTAETREFYKGENEFGVVGQYEDGRMFASILRDSDYFDHKRTDETKHFNSRKDIDDAREWLLDNIE